MLQFEVEESSFSAFWQSLNHLIPRKMVLVSITTLLVGREALRLHPFGPIRAVLFIILPCLADY